MKQVLVTGVGGFIGSALALHLLDAGSKVIGVDNFSLGHRRNVPAGIEFYEGDLSDSHFVSGLEFKSLDAIFHLAGQSGGELSFSDSLFDLDANVRSTHLLLGLMKRSGCNHLIYASSVAAYGDSPAGELGLHESQPINPTSPYGISKRSSEEFLRVMSKNEGIATASLRLFNVYGAGQDLTRMNQGMLSIYLGQALKSRKILVKGSLERYRDFVNVEDVVRAFVAVNNQLKTGHEIFNVCTGAKTYVSDALSILQRSFDDQLDIQVSGSTPGDVAGWVGSPEKIQTATGWKPEIAFEDGFRAMIETEQARWSE